MTDSSQKATFPHTTVGLDISDRSCFVVALNVNAEIVDRRKLALTEVALRKYFSAMPGARVAFEIGTHAHWIAKIVGETGCEVIVANARNLRLISHSVRKTDPNDAETLARLARSDIHLLAPIQLRGEDAQKNRAFLTARDQLVRSRKSLVNTCRSIAKSWGIRFPACSAKYLPYHARKQGMPADLANTITLLLDAIDDISEKIDAYDNHLEVLGEEEYPETQILRQIPGVGPLTAIAFVLAIEDHTRFRKSRDVGAYFGLTPKLRKSGTLDPQLGITKMGDRYVRQLLVGSAQYILGHFGPDCDLRRMGQAIADRGGKGAKKKAVVAVARKLGVLMHALWKNGSTYEPLRSQNREQTA